MHSCVFVCIYLEGKTNLNQLCVFQVMKVIETLVLAIIIIIIEKFVLNYLQVVFVYHLLWGTEKKGKNMYRSSCILLKTYHMYYYNTVGDTSLAVFIYPPKNCFLFFTLCFLLLSHI